MSQSPPKVFISYKWEDEAHNEWVKQLATDLRAAGIDAILDRWEVRLGDSFTDYMTAKIKVADAVLFIITTRSVAAAEAPTGEGGAVKFEVQMATSRRIAGESMRLIGILREGKTPPAHLRDHRYADFRNDSDYKLRLNELIDDLLGKDNRPPLSGNVGKTKRGGVQHMSDGRVAEERVEENGFLIIDSTPYLHEEGKIWDEPVHHPQAVKALLDTLWLRLRPHVPEHTYGKAWVLRNKKTGHVYWDLTIDLAAYHGLDREAQTLAEVGIASGMVLEIVPLRAP